ncbi:MAG: cation:proton antiporter [Actinomycetota bacterium]|nr:cation:proton antiporter [Actinomycetota bacterium]
MFGVAILAGVFLVYALVSRRLRTTVISGPMIFVGAGLIFGHGLGAVTVELVSEFPQLLLEGTLVIVLFSDAVLIDARSVRKEAFVPSRLLGLGLPLTIGLGLVLAALLFPELDLWTAAVVAIILAPTDAALGEAVVSNERVPRLIRQGLGVESGLNDGIAVPFLTIALAGAAGQMESGSGIARVFLEEIGWAVVAGLLVGLIGAWAVRFFSDKGWMGRHWRQVSIPALALLAFGLADPVGGSGFIAAFVAGLVFGSKMRQDYPEICDFSEGVAHLLTMLSFFVFGSLILGPQLSHLTWPIVVYSILSLTLVRVLPVGISLIGAGLRPASIAYLGWFGPRGLASLVFVGTVVEGASFPATDLILTIVAATVGLSVLAHGVSAWWGSNRYATWFDEMEEAGEDMMEGMDVKHLAARPRIHGVRM